MRAVGKWLLYMSLFVLTAVATVVVLGIGVFFVRYFYWVFIPSEVVYPVMFLGLLGIYRDPSESFDGIHSVYWVWDEEDRVWLLNSDDGQVYMYESVDGVWRKTHWIENRPGPIDRIISTPRSLYPSHWPDDPAGGHIVEVLPNPPGRNRDRISPDTDK